MTRRRWMILLDGVVAAVLSLSSVLSTISAERGAARWELGVAVTLICGSLALRTAEPRAVAVVFAIGAAAYTLTPGHHGEEPFLATLIVCFSVGAAVRSPWLGPSVLLLLAVGYPLNFDDPTPRSTTNLWLSPLVILGLPILIGVVLRRQREQSIQLARLSEELIEERELSAILAAADERVRIARELHDIVAHSVSAMVVQAGIAQHQLPAGSPARPEVLALRRTGKETLVELRRQLGVLREAQR